MIVAPGRGLLLLAALACVPACRAGPAAGPVEVTFPGSAVGAEGELLQRQLARFMEQRPDIRVVLRQTPDAADQRHQLYVQWLNAHAPDPDILQLDVIWGPEFAAAGWLLPLDRFGPDRTAFFPATIRADEWRDTLFAIPWFVDVGMLYWRTDLFDRPPATLDQLEHDARDAMTRHGLRYGLVWQGARYEGLITTFLEYLTAHGGAILDSAGRVVVDQPPGLAALADMRRQVSPGGIVPPSALTWHEEETRFAFQNGEAAFMRNWPYAYSLMEDSASSSVAGRFAVAPMPAAPGGHPAATLGGSQLGINRHSDHPEAAWAVIEYLTRPAQMVERARALGQFPARLAVYDDSVMTTALAVPPDQARRIIAFAVPRPVTPIYTQLSDLLQIELHRALTGQEGPAESLELARRAMQRELDRAGLGGDLASR